MTEPKTAPTAATAVGVFLIIFPHMYDSREFLPLIRTEVYQVTYDLYMVMFRVASYLLCAAGGWVGGCVNGWVREWFGWTDG